MSVEVDPAVLQLENQYLDNIPKQCCDKELEGHQEGSANPETCGKFCLIMLINFRAKETSYLSSVPVADMCPPPPLPKTRSEQSISISLSNL